MQRVAVAVTVPTANGGVDFILKMSISRTPLCRIDVDFVDNPIRRRPPTVRLNGVPDLMIRDQQEYQYLADILSISFSFRSLYWGRITSLTRLAKCGFSETIHRVRTSVRAGIPNSKGRTSYDWVKVLTAAPGGGNIVEYMQVSNLAAFFLRLCRSVCVYHACNAADIDVRCA